MSDLWDVLDDDETAGETSDEGAEPTGEAVDEPETSEEAEPEIAGVSLEALVKHPKWGSLAAELLGIRAERAAKAAADELAAKADAVADGDRFDAIPEAELREMFAARQARDAVGETERFLAQYERGLKAQGWGEETVAEKVKAEAEALAASAWLSDDSDPLWESPGYRAYKAEKAAQAGARQVAERAWVDSRTLLDDLADAEDEVAAALALARATS